MLASFSLHIYAFSSLDFGSTLDLVCLVNKSHAPLNSCSNNEDCETDMGFRNSNPLDFLQRTGSMMEITNPTFMIFDSLTNHSIASSA